MIRDNTPSPCNGCKIRSVGCHGKCNDYKAYCASNAEKRAARTKMLYNPASAFTVEASIKNSGKKKIQR